MMKHCDSNSSHSTIDTSGSARDLFPRKKEQTFSKVSVILAFFLPGLGQLIQKRWRTSIFIFSSYAVLIALLTFLLSQYDCQEYDRQEFYIDNRSFPLIVYCVFPLMMMFYSMFDAISWNLEEDKSHFVCSKDWEVFICVLLMCFLIAMLSPAIQASKGVAKKMRCHNRLKQIGLAMHNYANVFGTLPPAWTTDTEGKPLHSWRVLILPYIEQLELYKKIRLDEPWDSEYNRQFHSQTPTAFQCPETLRNGPIHLLKKRYPHFQMDDGCYYSVIVGNETVFPDAKPLDFKEITDGLDKTLMVTERLFPVCWMDPTKELTFDKALQGINSRIDGIGGEHKKGCLAIMADGSLRKLDDHITTEELKALLTRSGGESIVKSVK